MVQFNVFQMVQFDVFQMVWFDVLQMVQFPDGSVWCVPDVIQDGQHDVKVED